MTPILRPLLRLLAAGLLLLAVCLGRGEQTNIITATVTVTNAAGTTNGNTFTLLGYTYLFTNNPSSTFSLRQIQSTNVPARAATNLFTRLTNDFRGRLTGKYTGPTNFTLQTLLGGALTASIPTNPPVWGTVSLVTNVAGGGIVGASNIVAAAITLGGETRTNWAEGGAIYTNNTGLPGVVTGSAIGTNLSTLATLAGDNIFTGTTNRLTGDVRIVGELYLGAGTFIASNSVAGTDLSEGGVPLMSLTTTNVAVHTNFSVSGSASYTGLTAGTLTVTGSWNGSGATNLTLGIFTNAVLWVDAATGDNATARRGDPVHPYATIVAGVSNAIAGDEVVVLPGYYSESVAISNVITLFLNDGVTVYGKMTLWTNVTVRGEGVLTNYVDEVVTCWGVMDLAVKEIRQGGSASANAVVEFPQWGDPWPTSGGIVRARLITADATLLGGVVNDNAYYPETNIQVYVYVDRFEATNSPPIYTGMISEMRRQYIAPCVSRGTLNEDQFPGQIVGGPITVLP